MSRDLDYTKKYNHIEALSRKSKTKQTNTIESKRDEKLGYSSATLDVKMREDTDKSYHGNVSTLFNSAGN